MTTTEEIQGSWNQLAGAVLSKYSQVTGNDLANKLKKKGARLTAVLQAHPSMRICYMVR